MSVVAIKVLDDFMKLAPDEQLMVRERVISLTEARQHEALNRLRGSSTGKQLLNKLLVDRAGSAPVADAVVLDTSAILALTGNEPGADEVQSYLMEAIAGRIQLHGSFATLTEVDYITEQEEGAEAARQRLGDLKALPVQWLHTDAELCHEAAKLKATHKLSFADAFVAATAKRFDATLVHKDPEFQVLVGEVRQHLLPPKSGASGLS